MDLGKVFEKALDHSIAQSFLIFAAVLTSIVFWNNNKGILLNIALWMLICSFVLHYLTSLRKHESLGRYIVGNNHSQMILFTVTYLLAIVLWVYGIGLIFCGFKLPISILLLILILIIILVCKAFENKKIAEAKNDLHQSEKPVSTQNYTINATCDNCDLFKDKEVDIPFGIAYENFPCPKCKVAKLKKRS